MILYQNSGLPVAPKESFGPIANCQFRSLTPKSIKVPTLFCILYRETYWRLRYL